MKIKVTETTKWHISGYIIDANPELPEAPGDYFEKVQKEEKAEDKVIVNEVEEVVEKIIIKHDNKQVAVHILGMVLMTLGLFLFLKAFL